MSLSHVEKAWLGFDQGGGPGPQAQSPALRWGIEKGCVRIAKVREIWDTRCTTYSGLIERKGAAQRRIIQLLTSWQI